MSYSHYADYKVTGIEWLDKIPEHWTIAKVKHATSVNLSNIDKHTVEGQQAAFLCNYVDVYKNENITSELSFMRASASDEQIRRLSLKKHDVIITKDSESPDDIGVSALVSEELENVVCGYHLALLRPISQKTYGAYLHRALQSYFVRTQFTVAAVGMTRFGLGKYNIENALIPYPSFTEQTAIANFLDHETAKIDTLIAKQQRLIELLQEKRQALISHAVTKGLNPDAPLKDSGIEWIGEVPVHWELAGFTKFLQSIIDYRGKTPEKVDEGVFLVTAKNIKNGQIDYGLSQEFVRTDEYEEIMRRGRPQIGDLLFTTEAPLGEVANVDKIDIALAQRVIKFCGEYEILNNYFLKYWMMSTFFQQDLLCFATGSTALGIKSSKLSQLRVVLPTYLEQLQIVQYLESEISKLDILIRKTYNAINLLQERRSSLISAAVTGKIDVRGHV